MENQTELTKAVLEAVEANLPKASAALIVERLNRYQQLEQENEALIRSEQQLSKELSALRAQKAQVEVKERTFISKEEELEAIEKKLKQRELKLNEEILEIKLAAANQKYNDLLELNKIIFRNSVVKREVIRSTTEPNNPYVMTSENTTEYQSVLQRDTFGNET